MPTKPKTDATPTHNGRTIVGKKIEIRKTGGAFSEDLLVANPEDLADARVGTRMTLAVDVVCVDEHYPVEDRKEPDEGGVHHKLVFDPENVTIIDRELVAAAFDRQAERVQRAKDAADGQQRLPTDEELHAAHTSGEHSAGLVEGCVDCDEERVLGAAGK